MSNIIHDSKQTDLEDFTAAEKRLSEKWGNDSYFVPAEKWAEMVREEAAKGQQR